MKLNSSALWLLVIGMALSAPSYASLWDKSSENKDEVKSSDFAAADKPAEKTAEKVEKSAMKAAVKAEAKVEEKKAAAAAAPAPVKMTPEEEAARALKGVENQKAWIATLEKQLDGEKAKLVQMEAEAAKFGSGSKSKKS